MGGCGLTIVAWVAVGERLWHGWLWANDCGMGGCGLTIVAWVAVG